MIQKEKMLLIGSGLVQHLEHKLRFEIELNIAIVNNMFYEINIMKLDN